jgi:chromosomal replication initiation ATPase DnaA
MHSAKLFEKDLRDYLVDATEYDIKRITEIFDRHAYIREVVTKIEKVKVYVNAPIKTMPQTELDAEPVALITHMDIIGICLRVFGVDYANVKNRGSRRGRGDSKDILHCRMCAAYLIYKHTNWGVVRIGKFFGLDHSTITYYKGQINDFLFTKEEPYSKIIYIANEINTILSEKQPSVDRPHIQNSEGYSQLQKAV